MNRFLHIATLLMFGFAAGLWSYTSLDRILGTPSCTELIEELEPFKHCLQDGSGCNRDVEFYQKYHELHHKKLDLCN